MDKYLEYEDVDEEKKVRHVVTRLKVLVVEADYLPDSEVLFFSRVYTP